MRHMSISSQKVDVVCENQGLCFLKSYTFCIQFLEIYSLFKPMGTWSESNGQKESDTYIFITDFLG